MWELVGAGLMVLAMTTAAVFQIREARAALNRRRRLGRVTTVGPDLDGKVVVLEGRLVSTEHVVRFEDAARVLVTSAYSGGYRRAQLQAEHLRLAQVDGVSVALEGELEIALGSNEVGGGIPSRLGDSARERLAAAGASPEVKDWTFKSLSNGEQVRARGTLRVDEKAGESAYRGARRDYTLVAPLTVAFIGDMKRR